MITLFRRIRKSLIDSSAKRRYIIYAIGEIALVVIGILIALQVNNWNEDRKRRTNEKSSIQRLHQEAEQIVQYFDWMIDWIDRCIEESDAAAKALDRGAMVGIDSITFRAGIQNVTLNPNVSPPQSVYKELNSSGKFMEIRSDSLRTKIIEYYTLLEGTQSLLQYFRQTVYDPKDLARVDFYAVYDSTSSQRRTFKFNFDRLASNTAFKSEHISGLRNLIAFHKFRRDCRDLAIEMCRVLGEAAGVSCSSAD